MNVTLIVSMAMNCKIILKLISLGPIFIVLAATFSEWFWGVEIFSHYLPFAVIALLILALIQAFLKDKFFITNIIFLALAFPIFWQLHNKFETAQTLDGQVDIKVISYNVLSSNRNYQQVLALLKKENADVIFLAEVNQAWAMQLALFEKQFPCKLVDVRADNFGVAFFSKFPCVVKAPMFDNKIPYVSSIIGTPKGQVSIFGVHTLPPMGTRYMTLRDKQLMQLAGEILAIKMPTIVVGDLNATLFSKVLRDFIQQSGLQKTSGLYGYQFTWPAIFPLIQIDHGFVKNIKQAAFKVLKGVGSDHRPVKLEVTLK